MYKLNTVLKIRRAVKERFCSGRWSAAFANSRVSVITHYSLLILAGYLLPVCTPEVVHLNGKLSGHGPRLSAVASRLENTHLPT